MGYGDLRKGRYSAIFHEYLVTTVCAGRKPLFRDHETAHTLIQELNRADLTRNAEWLAWVLMPDHFHALLKLNGDWSLSQTIKCVKGRSARAIGGRVWQPGFHDHALREEEDRLGVARYLLANPIRADIVTSLRDYPYWHCTWITADDDPDAFLGG